MLGSIFKVVWFAFTFLLSSIATMGENVKSWKEKEETWKSI